MSHSQAFQAVTINNEGEVPRLNKYLADNGLTTTKIVVLDVSISSDDTFFMQGSVSADPPCDTFFFYSIPLNDTYVMPGGGGGRHGGLC